MRFIAKEWNGEVRGRKRPVLLPLYLRELQRPAGVPVLVGQIYRLAFPALGDPSCPKIGFLSVVL